MSSEPASRGLLETTGLRLLTRTARVDEVTDLRPRFRRIRLTGEALRGRDWTPGDTVRLVLPGWHKRCYTPMTWDGERGLVDFVAYVHGDGPASDWAASVRVGDECQVRGPRGAIDLRSVGKPAMLFGDETSLTTAAALRAIDARTKVVLEVESVSESQAALASIGVEHATLLARGQLDEVADLVLAHLQSDTDAGVALTGQSGSIQRVYKTLRHAGVSARRVKNHAYWTPGKTGLE